MENLDKHFHMSDKYEKHSSSQKTIGQTTIEETNIFAQKNLQGAEKINALDIACGPGNLTIDLKKELEKTFPESEINLTGLDYSENNVKKLQNSGENVEGVAGSFYELPIQKESEDVIFSNEGLHWQPPYETEEIIYTHLSEEEKEKYENWALENFKKSLENIYDSLKEEGVAVLQFGHEGQLQKLWDLIKETLEKNNFTEYKKEINFPLYYPSLDKIQETLNEVGFKDENVEITDFNQDLAEETPEEIAEFLRAFTEPSFKQIFDEKDLEKFYNALRKELENLDIENFRKDQWHRTLIKLKK